MRLTTAYYLPTGSVIVTPNCFGSHRMVQVNVVAGTTILLDAITYKDFLSMTYEGEYPSFAVRGNSIALPEGVENDKVFIYLQISANSQQGNIVFLTDNKTGVDDICDSLDGETIYVRLGYLSPVNIAGERSLYFDEGMLQTASGDNTVLQQVQQTVIQQVENNVNTEELQKQIQEALQPDKLEQKLSDRFLSKTQNDETAHHVGFKSISTTENAEIGGSLSAASAEIGGNTTISGSTTLNGTLLANKLAEFKALVKHMSASEWGTFVKGLLTGSGAQIDAQGNAEFESLVSRRFIETAELRFQRIRIQSGIDWLASGGGLIESVEPIDDTHGKIKLHLEDGEYGTIAVDDYCMGIFHNVNGGNATTTHDDKDGTIEVQGSTTVYFRVQEITDASNNSEFIYELRPVSEGWSKQAHPMEQMSFVAYANPTDDTRQDSILQTTKYTLYLEKCTQWTFGPDNYAIILGDLTGFSVWATNTAGKRYLKHLYGKGAMIQNLYQYGISERFDRLADTVEVTVSPRINADYSLADGETMTLSVQMKSWEGIKRTDATFSIKRFSDNPESDAEWNALRGNDIKNGTIALTTEDLRIDKTATVPDGSPSGSIYDLAVQFTITASRTLPSSEGGDVYSVERDVVIKNTGRIQMVINMDGDPFLAWGETKHITCNILSPRGNADITDSITLWKVERNTGDALADQAWNQGTKAQAFNGAIDIALTDTVNDIGANNSAVFIFTAYIGIEPQAQAILEI